MNVRDEHCHTASDVHLAALPMVLFRALSTALLGTALSSLTFTPASLAAASAIRQSAANQLPSTDLPSPWLNRDFNLDIVAPVQLAQAIPNTPDDQRWLAHVKTELLPFWTTPGALGNPIGKFPSVRCNDGSAVNYSSPCPEVAGNYYLLENRNYVVSMSRQVYGYGVAFHLSGDPKYLQYAKAGVDYLRQNAIDRQNGGTHTYFDNNSQTWGPAPGLRNTQELAYALLGMSFYYYLTRDAAVLADIQSLKDNIFGKYYNSSLQSLQWQLQDGNGNRALDKRFVAQIDQLSYMFLVIPTLPAAQQTAWKADMEKVINAMLRDFYSPANNLFFLSSNSAADRDINQVGADFGHTAKGFWTVRLAGRMLGKQNWIDFTNANAPKHLQRAYLSSEGAWGTAVKVGGVNIDGEKSWWIHAELDQLSSVLALQDRNQGRYLPQTYSYWLNTFLDKNYGEVWTTIAAGSNQPIGLPKAWAWKNAYHSFEHGLFAYITTAQYSNKPIQLYYAFKQRPANSSINPHVFKGSVNSVQTSANPNGGSIYKVQFSNLSF
jgi:mannose/cellobiose epimerase-like protein (N-acyl-D-glucosamine 2-epimerase family)